MGVEPYFFILSKCKSPVTMYSAPDASAQAIILSSSGSSFTKREIWTSGKRRLNLYKPARSSSVEVLQDLILDRNFGLSKTWRSSSEMSGVRQILIFLSSANLMILCDGPTQRRPEIKTLTSSTTRIMPSVLCERDEFLW